MIRFVSFISFFAFLVRLPTGQGKVLASKNCTESKNAGGVCEKVGMSGVCYNGECFVALPSKVNVSVRVRYPLDNLYLVASTFNPTTVWLRGNGLGLTWDKGQKMKKSGATDTWEFLLEFTIHSTATSMQDPLGKFEFRVYLDDRVDMLGANFVLPLPPSTNPVNTKNIPTVWVYPWFYSKMGKTEKRTIYSPELNQNRSITVHTPASFAENKYKRYETLFVNDGQRLKAMVPQIDNLVVTKALLKEVLLIGVDNNFIERTQLMAPSNGSDAVCKTGNQSTMCNNCLTCTSDSRCSYQRLVNDYRRCYNWVSIPHVYGQRYLDFIQNTLIPDSKTSYRPIPGAAHVGILGFSLGGLVACHAIWTRPQTFGSAACMSPSLWWPFPENATFPDDAQYEFVTSTLGKYRGERPRQKIYIDVGDDEGYIMEKPARNAIRILANTSYFEMNKNLWFYEWRLQDHNYKRVLERAWVPLLALYGAEGSPTAKPKNIAMQTSRTASEQYNHVFLAIVAFLGVLDCVYIDL